MALSLAAPALALEMPIGKPQKQAGMEIAAVYLQPVPMEPAGMMKAVAESDIHLEADIRAQENNANGFAEGTWIPYLGVAYEITKAGSAPEDRRQADADGGERRPPLRRQREARRTRQVHAQAVDRAARRAAHAHFGRHTDKETGVGPWFKPFTVEYEFTYAGIGKKGGY